MFYILFDKILLVVLIKVQYVKPASFGVSYTTNSRRITQPIIRKVQKRKAYSSFKDNICGADLVDM